MAYRSPDIVAVVNFRNHLTKAKKGITMAKPNLNEYISVTQKNYLSDNNEGRMIKGNLFDFETPLCKAFNEFNYLLKIDTDLFTFNIQEIRTYEEHEYELNHNMTGDLGEPWSDNRDYKWYDELTDGVLKEEALIHKARFEESWGDATPRVMKLCAWLKNSFENFHELDHDVLVKLEECWNYGANNAGDTQDSQEHKKEHIGNEHTLSSKLAYDPSVCHVRRFKTIKYSFNVDDEYIAIKEHEFFDHSRTNIDA
ncbi:hypothetical protein Tco_0397580 [Tanacetum coccineum]